jgi:hypothetical protein
MAVIMKEVAVILNNMPIIVTNGCYCEQFCCYCEKGRCCYHWFLMYSSHCKVDKNVTCFLKDSSADNAQMLALV